MSTSHQEDFENACKAIIEICQGKEGGELNSEENESTGFAVFRLLEMIATKVPFLEQDYKEAMSSITRDKLSKPRSFFVKSYSEQFVDEHGNTLAKKIASTRNILLILSRF